MVGGGRRWQDVAGGGRWQVGHGVRFRELPILGQGRPATVTAIDTSVLPDKLLAARRLQIHEMPFHFKLRVVLLNTYLHSAIGYSCDNQIPFPKLPSFKCFLLFVNFFLFNFR